MSQYQELFEYIYQEFNYTALESEMQSLIEVVKKLPEFKQLEARCKELEENNYPKLRVTMQSFPESNGKRNWTAFFKRVDKFDGLIGSCGGIVIDHGECWNRVAYEAERAKFLIGERDNEPDILDYGDDIETPEEWKGEVHGGREV